MPQSNINKTPPVQVSFGNLPFGDDPHLILIVSCDPDGDKKWTAQGTGFPVLCDNMLTIITAAHVTRGLSGKPVVLIGPSGSLQLSPHECRVLQNSEIDLALISISSEDMVTLFGVCNCIELDFDTVACTDSGTEALYQLYGYPQSKNKYSRTEGWNYEAFRVSLGLERPIPARSALRALKIPLLGFDIDLKKMVDDDYQRNSRLGRLQGMSGGPVIRHPIHGTANGGKIAGIFLEWHLAERTAIVLPALAIVACIKTWHATAGRY